MMTRHILDEATAGARRAPGPWPWGRCTLAALELIAASACGGQSFGDVRSGRSASQSETRSDTLPTATRRLSRLLREQLTAANPVETEQAIACEMARIDRALPYTEATRQMDLAMARADTNAADSAARYKVGNKMAGTVVEFQGLRCVPFDAVAERELPLPPKRDP